MADTDLLCKECRRITSNVPCFSQGLSFVFSPHFLDSAINYLSPPYNSLFYLFTTEIDCIWQMKQRFCQIFSLPSLLLQVSLECLSHPPPSLLLLLLIFHLYSNQTASSSMLSMCQKGCLGLKTKSEKNSCRQLSSNIPGRLMHERARSNSK